jgi:hypothetical protein
MGQLDVFSLEDISVVTILAGPVSTYLSEEIEVSIESVVAYVYSANILVKSKKRCKLISTPRYAGDTVGQIYKSWNLLQLATSKFSVARKALEDQIMWQDSYLSQWEGASDRKNLERLETKYSW